MFAKTLVNTFVSHFRPKLCGTLFIGKNVEENILIRQLMILFLLKFDVIERENALLSDELFEANTSV